MVPRFLFSLNKRRHVLSEGVEAFLLSPAHNIKPSRALPTNRGHIHQDGRKRLVADVECIQQ
jgi:hypothetical protein